MATEKFERPERPAYRVLDVAGFYGDDDTLYAEGAEIFFDGEPCVEMEALNEPAREKMEVLLQRLDDAGRAAAEKAGRAYVGRPRTLDGGLELATAIQRQEMAVMGAEKHSAKEGISPVIREEAPIFGQTEKRGRGRPKKFA